MRDEDLPDHLKAFEVQDVCGCGVAHGPGDHHHHHSHGHAAPVSSEAAEGPKASALHDLLVEAGASMRVEGDVIVAASVPGADAARLKLIDLSHLAQVAVVPRGAGAETRIETALPALAALQDGEAVASDGRLLAAPGGQRIVCFLSGDAAELQAALAPDVMVKALRTRVLLALAGEERAAVTGLDMAPGAARVLSLAGAEVWAFDAGGRLYLSVPEEAAEAVARHILAAPGAALAGLDHLVR